MGLFSRKPDRVGRPAPVVLPPPTRGVPQLYPEFYEECLRAAGKPVTVENIAAVAGLTTMNLALNAHRWIEMIGPPTARAEWDARFASRHYDPSVIIKRPDDMIDFLWNYSPRIHPGIQDFVRSMRGTIVSSCQNFGPQLPEDMWSSK